MEFDYPSWARHGIGSTVTFESNGSMDVTATLLECDAEKAVLRIACRTSAPLLRRPEPTTFTQVLPAHPSREQRPPSFFPAWERRASPAPVHPYQFSLSMVKAGDSVQAEGDEILEIAGEEWMTHWVERVAKHLDHDVRLRCWRSEKVPGGLVKLQVWTGPEDISPYTWSVKSFERK